MYMQCNVKCQFI